MDDINDFFDFSKPFKRTVVSGGYLNGRTLADDTLRCDKISKREVIGNEYARDVATAQEIGMLEDTYAKMSAPSTSSFMETMEDIDDSEDCEMEIKPNLKDDVYEKYNFSKKTDLDLPIFDAREKIIELIKTNRIIILEGDTGCGKTTQIPQFVLEDAYRKREHCNIVCTQPRRIAAISIAQRVCDERNWKIGSIVGYQVGLHKEVHDDTRLLYCTTGVLLQKLIKKKSLGDYTHIILDEVHERDQEMDFLLIVIKKLIRNAPCTKIILMSATINTKQFSEYFQTMKDKTLIPAPVLKVDNRRLYTVKDFYIDDLKKITATFSDFKIDYESAGISNLLYKIVLKLIIHLESIDQQEENQGLSYKPSVLIFLPGINEIDSMEKTLESIKMVDAIKLKVLVIRLHSMISPDEQQKAFRKPASGYRKIILATNIAESSITVPDVKYVIDFCLTKNLVTNTNTNLTCLQLQWASKSNCKQRAGRAGRVMNGRVFRLVTRNFYDNYMSEHGIPELTRCPLENVVLKAKMLEMGAPHNVLGLALNPPNLSDIRNTILILREAGALFQTPNEGENLDDGDLTFIGRVMAQLPLDIRFSRLIIFGYMFGILEETIIIAAGLSVKSIFDYPYQNQLSAYSSKVNWSNGSGSDLFAIISAYRVWVSKYEQQQFQREDAEVNWSRRFYINSRSMREMHYLILELKSRLVVLGIKENTGYNRVNWFDHEKSIALKIVIAGAFYPNFFVRSCNDQYETERSAYHTLCGRNPCNTVYFASFDNKFIGQLYVKSIKDIFKKAMITYKNIEVSFEDGTQKIFVTFNSDPTDDYTNINNLRLSLPGRVRPEVYKAIKMRHLQLPTSIRVMPAQDAVSYAIEKNLGQSVDGKFEFNKKHIEEAELLVIPSVFTKYERGKISFIENCGKFWFQPKQVENQLKHILINLNNTKNLYTFKSFTEINRGMIVAVKYRGRWYRGKVIRKEEESKICLLQFKVIFIDYGDVVSIDMSNLYGIKPIEENSVLFDLPPRAFECYLAGIAPSAICSENGQWTLESTEFFKEIIKKEYEQNKPKNEIEIYSVVNRISAVVLNIDSGTVNDILVKNNLAQYCEENYMSKLDHDLRGRKQYEQRCKSFNYFLKNEEENLAFSEEYIRQNNDVLNEFNIEPPLDNKCTIKLNLRGPLSPLECVCHAITRAGTWKSVRIERDSVNSVLLNADPQDNHERLIVAANISACGDGDLTARQTTIMPNIKGFAPLMALIFCPRVEIRRNKSKTRFSSILCGLGPKTKNSKEPLFAEHDIVFNLNVEISEHDIQIINKIRYAMDTILSTNPGEHIPKSNHKTRNDMTVTIKTALINLLEKDRQYVEIENNINGIDWNLVDLNDMLKKRNVYEDEAIFPPHDCMRLYNEPYEHIENLRKNCEQLHEYKRMNLSIPDDLTCDLCGQKLNCILQLRIHLLSKLHQDREKQINFKQK